MNISKKSEMPILYIRADGNGQIGTGHLMRCLSIADAWREIDGESIFLVADEENISLIEGRGYKVICLHSRWNLLEQELEKLCQVIEEQEMSLLLVDSYYVSELYMKTLSGMVRLVYIDDIGQPKYPCSIRIRYSIAQKVSQTISIQCNQRELSGPLYAPLRLEYADFERRKVRREVEKVLILTGGTDPYSLSLELAQHVKKSGLSKSIQFIFVCGMYNRDREKLIKLQTQDEKIIYISHTNTLWEYMRDCDLAVSAGGVTLYELCAAGLPTICYCLADNQLENSEGFAKIGLMRYAGDIRMNKDVVIQKIEEYLMELTAHYDDRCEMAAGMQRFIDGNGARRIARALLD